MAFTIDFKILKNSIVNGISIEDLKEDQTDPFSFIDFVKKLNIGNVSNDFIVDTYNRYLIEWSRIKKLPENTFIEQRKLKYTQLLKTIQIDYVTQDEERILSNLDFDNPLEMEVAIPFFVEKIKDIIEYYKNRRTLVKSSKSKWSTKGSSQFLKNTIAEYIIHNYTQDNNTFQRYKQDYQELSSFQSNYQLEYNGLYDTKTYEEEEITINNSDFLKDSGDYVLSSLPITAFSDYNRDTSTLISELKKDLFKKYVTLDNTYYASTTSVDIESTTPFHDNLNLSNPNISRISTTDGLLPQKDIGYYFSSRFIMASKYISPKGISIKNTNNFIGMIPKIDIYYQNDYIDYYLWHKYDPSYMGMSNKPIRERRLKRFHGYESRNVRVGDSSGGINRYTDTIQLWQGNQNEIWANDDIFDKYVDNVLNRDNKESYFFTLDENESVYKYSVDIYGNEYYLIKEIDKQESSQNNIYPLPSFLGEVNSTVGFILLGQRYQPISPLSAIEIDTNFVIGFDTSSGIDDDIIENVGDFHLNDMEYYTLNSSNYNTIPLSSNLLSSGKSVYEYGLSTGKLIVRTADSKTIQNYSEFVDDVFGNFSGLYTQLSSDIVNFDITGDLIIITTTDYTFISKINFNFTTSVLTYSDLNKNVITNYNDVLHKSAKYWNSSIDNSVYFANISATDDYIIPTINKLNLDDNTINNIDLNNINLSEYEHDYPISLESISTPNIIKQNNSLYIVTLLKDICGNYVINVIEFEETRPSILDFIKNTLYKQSFQSLDENLLSSNSLTSIHSEVQSSLSSNLVYYSTGDGIIEESVPEFTLSSYTYYDNDQSSIVSINKPDLKYNLSDIVSTLTTSSITTDEETYTYDTVKIYSPSDITIDITNLSSFSTYVPPTEHIIKIEYDFGGEVIVKNISNSDLKSTLYDTTFAPSPLNQTAIVYDNTLGSGFNFINIRLYSTTSKIYTFEFQIDQWSIDISNRFAKLELLDSRINVTNTGNNLIMYLNSRIPDYLIPLKIINI